MTQGLRQSNEPLLDIRSAQGLGKGRVQFLSLRGCWSFLLSMEMSWLILRLVKSWKYADFRLPLVRLCSDINDEEDGCVM